MRIGFDISFLTGIKDGHFYYTLSLLRNLNRIDSRSEYILAGYRMEEERLDSLLSSLLPNHNYSVRFISKRKIEGFMFSETKMGQSTLFKWSSERLDWRMLRPAFDRLFLRRKSKLASRVMEEVDVFHIANLLPCQPDKKKLVTTVHDLTTVLFPGLQTKGHIIAFRQHLEFARDYCTHIIVDSKATKLDLMSQFGIEKDRISIIHLGVKAKFNPNYNEEEIRRVGERYNIGNNEYILFVGVIEPRKNLKRLMEAFALLQKDRKFSSVQLVIAGALGWKYEDILATYEDLKSQYKIRLIGKVDEADLPVLYNGAGIFVYPSLYEGFGLPPLEAMACGTPVITSNVSSLPEVVGEAGVLINPYSSEEIAEAMKRLLSDEALREELIEKGLKRASSFTWEKTAAETLNVYENIAGKVGKL